MLSAGPIHHDCTLSVATYDCITVYMSWSILIETVFLPYHAYTCRLQFHVDTLSEPTIRACGSAMR